MVTGSQVRYRQRMRTFEYILIGPDGQVFRGQQPLMAGSVPMEIDSPSKEGPFDLTARYRRTSHKIEGRIRFDWVESERKDNGTTYRLAVSEAPGQCDLVNDPE